MEKTACFFHVRRVWLTVVIFYLSFFVSKQKPDTFWSDFSRAVISKASRSFATSFAKSKSFDSSWVGLHRAWSGMCQSHPAACVTRFDAPAALSLPAQPRSEVRAEVIVPQTACLPLSYASIKGLRRDL